MKTLHLTLFRRWFIDILEGTKTEEYREIKPFWAKRLFQDYDTMTFRNGYAKDAPLMVVEFKGVEILLDRAYGKPKMSHELSGKDGGPMSITITREVIGRKE